MREFKKWSILMPLSMGVVVVSVVPSGLICALRGEEIALLNNNPKSSEHKGFIYLILTEVSSDYTDFCDRV